jgi:hypothetical protein
MSEKSAKQNFSGIMKAAGFAISGNKYVRKSDGLSQIINIYSDRIDGRKYIEYEIRNNDGFLVSGRADRAFLDRRYEIMAALSGEAPDANFDFTSWLIDDFLCLLDEMRTPEGVLKICRDQLDGKALISAEVRRSW